MDKNEIHLIDRKTLDLCGVDDVSSFDESRIVLLVGEDMLYVQGFELHIQKLSLESGEVSITGEINAVFFDSGESTNKKGILSRFLK